MRWNTRLMAVHVLLAGSCALGGTYAQDGMQGSDQDVVLLLEYLHRPDITGQEMLAVELALQTIDNVAAVRPAFQYLSRNPVAWAPGGTGNAHLDAEIRDGDAVHLYEARQRVWRHLGRNVEPVEERKRIITALFDEWTTEEEFSLLLRVAPWNASEDIANKLWGLFVDPTQPLSIRSASVDMLAKLVPGKYTPAIVDFAWAERGSELSRYVGGRFGGPRYRDPRLSGLKIDWYQVEAAVAHEAGVDVPFDVYEKLDLYFKITGEPQFDPSTVTDAAETRDKWIKMMRAQDQHERALAAAYKKGLEEHRREFQRVQRIRVDQWLVKNRDRLEQEAANFARQREKERHDEREPQRREQPRGD